MAVRMDVNFCRSAQISVCTANSAKEQSGCRFFEKASRSERCMYFMFEEYCDCLGAQLGAAGRAADGPGRLSAG
jgi:hypothetical protein